MGRVAADSLVVQNFQTVWPGHNVVRFSVCRAGPGTLSNAVSGFRQFNSLCSLGDRAVGHVHVSKGSAVIFAAAPPQQVTNSFSNTDDMPSWRHATSRTFRSMRASCFLRNRHNVWFHRFFLNDSSDGAITSAFCTYAQGTVLMDQ